MVEAALRQRSKVRRARAEKRHAGPFGELPEGSWTWMERVAIVEDRRAPQHQRPYEIVPHHPACRGVPEHPIPSFQVVVKRKGLQLLEEYPSVAVHDGLWHAGRSRRVED